jgi:hypothetical protein
VPATFVDGLLERFGARTFFRRQNLRAMRRLRGILEGEEAPRAQRVTVAGG